MANDYTTSTDAFADMREAGVTAYTSSDYTQMAGFVTAASRLIDRECGRWPGFFYPTTDAKTYIYDGSGYETQEIDEFASVTSVSVSEQGGVASSDYTAWGSTDYYAWPYNATNNGKPIIRLVADALNGSKSYWHPYRKAVKVVGVPGYATAVPSEIALACRMQSVRWFMRARQGYQDAGAQAEIGGLTFKGKLELDPDIKALLWPFKLELS